MNKQNNFKFWWNWLVIVDAGVALFGLSMVLFPGFIQQVYSLLVYAAPDKIAAFGQEAVRYITLAHGVLGSVMFGWGIALMFVLFGQFREGARSGWLTLAVSLAAWFLPDTAISLSTGFWQNAVLNLGFAILFAIPLAATRPAHQ